ncbi:hypothetical protein ACVIHI_002654 [Bradyrhizobium sp. USDA 4524]|uniref:hypothetical protein n=1 Tax=unclassified Bradyrhizobium TaxID=2631580 RepID=UPI0020A05203|nr:MULTISPECIES: hypothetical protein [unclassified Bradyrhizobium]MCP1844425.1 hypothetical protein [Bradyrhizobium sp. USDA 4538]MCP1904991.1 hypothetical protein [Bradyrhizobium sp. USDA 4537]MCP1989353.1 hypothetical protein [Bradyrhizobium sp. USDA 4539]
MKAPLGAPAESAGGLYFRTDVSPEQIFQAIGRLRKEARDEIDRLIRFLDKTDDYVSRELEDDGDAEPSIGGDDREPDLGSFDRMLNQEHCNRQRLGEETAEVDAEQDQADSEPSLGAVERHPYCLGWPEGSNPTGDQTHWAAGGRRDLEQDPAASGIGDLDGLREQVGTQDSFQGAMA